MSNELIASGVAITACAAVSIGVRMSVKKRAANRLELAKTKFKEVCKTGDDEQIAEAKAELTDKWSSWDLVVTTPWHLFILGGDIEHHKIQHRKRVREDVKFFTDKVIELRQISDEVNEVLNKKTNA